VNRLVDLVGTQPRVVVEHNHSHCGSRSGCQGGQRLVHRGVDGRRRHERSRLRSELEEPRHVVGDRRGDDDDDGVAKSTPANAIGGERRADGQVPLGGDEDREPDGRHLGDADHGPGVDLQVAATKADGAVADRCEVAQHRHDLLAECANQQYEVGQRQRLQRRQRRRAGWIAGQHPQRQRIANDSEHRQNAGQPQTHHRIEQIQTGSVATAADNVRRRRRSELVDVFHVQTTYVDIRASRCRQRIHTVKELPLMSFDVSTVGPTLSASRRHRVVTYTQAYRTTADPGRRIIYRCVRALDSFPLMQR